jgi:hypothetical protein
MKRFSLLVASVLCLALCGCRLLPRVSSAPASAVRTAAPSALAAGSAAPTTGPAAATVQPTAAAPAKPDKSEALAAFEEIAFTSEYGDKSSQIRKWIRPIAIAVHGGPSAEDLAALNRAMDGLNAVEGFPGIRIASPGSQNADIWFVKLDEMKDDVPDYVEGNWGYFTTIFERGIVSSASIAIATDVTDQTERNHLIFEEVLQSTGLMQDSNKYADSIFYGPWTTVQQPSALDWELLRMLYMPRVKPGMAQEQAMDILQKDYVPR